MVSVKKSNDRRLDATLRSAFVSIIVKEIRNTGSPAFRLHDVGDFYSVEYIEKWKEIANNLPEVIFFGSTRSWRCDFLSEPMKRFRDMENVYIKASVDLTDTLNPKSCGWNVWSVEGEGLSCPHDEGLVENCVACQRCWTVKGFDLNFKLRWGDRGEYLTPRLFN